MISVFLTSVVSGPQHAAMFSAKTTAIITEMTLMILMAFPPLKNLHVDIVTTQ
jgi:hypothetical protein